MPTINYVEELEYTDAKGLDTTSPINLLVAGFVREALNTNLGSTGGYTKRDGFIDSGLAPVTGFSILQGIEYKRGTGPAETFLYTTNNTSAGEFGKVINNVFTPVKRFDEVLMADQTMQVSPFDRPSIVQVGEGLYYFDGSGGVGNSKTPFVYEGNTTYVRTLGIEPPSQKPTAVVSGSGSDLIAGDYIFAYTYAFFRQTSAGDYTLIAESSPSPFSDTITVATLGEEIELTLQPYAPAGNPNLTHLDVVIRIWRTVANGNILFYEGETPATASTYTATKGDNSLLSQQMPLDNTTLSTYLDYNKAKFPVVARNRLLVFHPDQNRGRFSKISVDGPLPESFPVQNEFSVEGRFGSADSIVGAGQIKGIPVVLKERSIGRLEEVGLPDLGNSEDNVVYIYREISETVGAVSHFAQCQVFDELLFLGRDNVYATDGQNIRPIATQIQSTIRDLDFRPAKAKNISAINDTKNKRVYIQVFKTIVSQQPDLTLVGDYQQYPQFRWTVYGAGPDPLLYPGIKAGCFFQTEATSDGGLDIYFGNTDDSGKLFKMNSGETDDGEAILMRIVSRPYMFGQPLITKLYKSAKIYVEARDPSYDFQFGAKFDLDETELNVKSYTVPGVGTVWGPPNPGQLDYIWFYDAAEAAAYQALTGLTPPAPLDEPALVWSGPSLREYTYNVHKKAKLMQLVFTQDDQDAPLTLLGWGVTGSIFSGI